MWFDMKSEHWIVVPIVLFFAMFMAIITHTNPNPAPDLQSQIDSLKTVVEWDHAKIEQMEPAKYKQVEEMQPK